jgi:hypothetical protein
MEWGLLLRWFHLIGAAVLLGSGAGIAFFMVMAHRTRDARLIAHTAGTVVIADWLFTASGCRATDHGRIVGANNRLVVNRGLDRAVAWALHRNGSVLAASCLDAAPNARSGAGRGTSRRGAAGRVSSPLLLLVRLRDPGVSRDAGDSLADGGASPSRFQMTLDWRLMAGIPRVMGLCSGHARRSVRP